MNFRKINFYFKNLLRVSIFSFSLSIINTSCVPVPNSGNSTVKSSQGTAQRPTGTTVVPLFNTTIDADGNGILLSWPPFSGSISSYQILLYSDSACTLDLLSKGFTTNTNFVLNGLSEGNYYAKIQATAQSGLIGESLCSSNSVSVDTLPPSTSLASISFTNLYDNDGNNIAMTFSGITDSGTGIASYTIEIYNNMTCLGAPSYSFPTGTTSGIDNGVVDGLTNGTYWAKIKAYDVIGYNSTTPCSTDSIIVDTTAPTVSQVSSTLANATYQLGQVVPITVQFSEVVNVTGTPQLQLNTGGNNPQLNYASGTGTNTLTFNYTVASGDTSNDLEYLATTSLTLNTGTILDPAGNAATLTLPSLAGAGSLSSNKALVIDSAAPTVSSISSVTDGSVIAGSNIDLTVVFTEPVIVNTLGGTPRIKLETGATDQYANYISGTGTSNLIFRYIPIITDAFTDLEVFDSASLTLNGGLIKDVAGNNADLTTIPSAGGANSLSLANTLILDTTIPVVSNVTTPTDGTYKAGQSIFIDVVFDDTVVLNTTGGSPTLTLNAGPNQPVITYSSQPAVTTLRFSYTVGALDSSTDLDYFSTSSLVLNGATLKDSSGNNVNIALPAPAAAGSLAANQALVIDTTAPTITNVTTSSGNGPFKTGDTINIEVTFSETLATPTGTPRIQLATNSIPLAYANYTGVVNATTLNFAYIVASGESSSDLETVNAYSLSLNNGTITDTVGNAAILTLPALGGAIVVDAVAPYVLSVSATNADGGYSSGNTLDITVLFSESVVVTGSPTLDLNMGSTQATNAPTGTGTNTLTFQYTIQAGDASLDLSYTTINALALNAGTIKDTAGNDATITLATPGAFGSLSFNKNIVIDSVSPTITSISSTTADGYYGASSSIAITVTFDEIVNVTGVPLLKMANGGAGIDASYVSGSGSTILTFNYIVQAGDNNSDLEVDSIGALTVTGATIKDASLNDATLDLTTALGTLPGTKAIVVDTTPSTVSSVTSTDLTGTYRVNETVTIDVNFNEIVVVDTTSGTPQLLLETGTTDRPAIYSTGSGTSTLSFIYTVVVGDSSPNLDYFATTSLSNSGGTIKDRAGNNVTLTLPALNGGSSLIASKNFTIDGDAPYITSVAANPSTGNYNLGDTINIEVTFSTNVDVTGAPTLQLETGTNDTLATYFSGTGSAVLVFHYTVVATDTSADLNYKAINSLALNGGTIRTAGGGNYASTGLLALNDANALAGTSSIVIDTTNPTVSSITSSTANGSYKASDVISIQVVFSEPVDVTGTPQLQLATAGGVDELVNYTSGTGTTTLTFDYTISSGDASNDLEILSSSALTLNLGTILDPSGNAATLTLPIGGSGNSLGDNKNFIIDTVAPTISNVSSTVTADGTYKAGDIIYIDVTFDEDVNVTGSSPGNYPTLTLNTTPTNRAVEYSSSPSADTLRFAYTVQATDTSADLDYLATGSLINNGVSTILDTALNPATLTLAAPAAANSLGANKAIVIDTTAPTVSNVTSSAADATYIIGNTIPIIITFDEAVYVTGTPQLTMETGATDTMANYSSGSGTTTLTFNYIVASGDNSADLDYASTAALILNSGTINDFAGNAATLTLATPNALNSISDNQAIVIDGVAPTISSVSASTADGSYKAASTIDITITFSENVDVVTTGGTPRIELQTGNGPSYANYLSGTETKVLTFRYTVLSGDNSTDLEYVSTSSLSLNGGTLLDTLGNPADLTLPAFPTANSISGSKAIVIDTTLPTITGVTSSTGNGNFKNGGLITIDVTFSESVTVATATPTLTLNTTPSNAVVNYTSGSPGTTLSFNFTVAAENSTDLEYLNSTALALAGATIRDAAGNDATLTLPTPGATGSLGVNQDIVVDTIAPTITNVTAIEANGYYKNPGTLNLSVVFSEPVTVVVDGVNYPLLSLETGAIDTDAVYNGGTAGTNTLNFLYTIIGTDASGDLAYKATNSLTLPGITTIKDPSGNSATLTLASPGLANSLSFNKAIIVDNSAPVDNFTNPQFTDPSDNDGNNIAMTWTAFTDLESGLANHTIKLYSDSGCTTLTNTFVTNSTGNTDNSVVTGLLNGNYYTKVSAANNVGQSTESACSTDSILVDNLVPVDNTANLTFVSNYDSDGNNVFVNWTAFTDANLSNHNLYTYTDSACTLNEVDHGLTNATSNSNNSRIQGLTDGQYWGKVEAFDLANNSVKSACSTDSIIVDTLAPNATGVTVTFTAPAYDSDGNNIQIDWNAFTEVNLTNYKIELYSDSGCTTLVTDFGYTNNTGAVTNNTLITGVADGTYYGAISARDAIGRETKVCSSNTLTVDATPPSTPSALTLMNISTPGNLTTPTIRVSGTTSGDTIKLYSDTGCISQVGSLTASGATTDIISSALADGSYSFSAKATDPGGLSSGCYTAATIYTLDTVAPSDVTLIALLSPASSPTTDNTPTLRISGTSSSDVISLHGNNSCTSLIGQAVAPGATTDITVSPAVSDGIYTFSVKSTDTAGNTSNCVVSTSNLLTIDATAPTAPTGISLVTPASSPGNNATPTLRIAGTVVGDSIKVFSDACTTMIGSATATVGTTTDITTSSLADGSLSFWANSTDPLGNISTCYSAGAVYTLDTVAPSDPTSLVLDSGPAASNAITTPPIRINGTTNGDTITLYSDNACATQVGQTTAVGDPTVITTSTLAEGLYEFSAKATDPVGNNSACVAGGSVLFTYDNTTPLAPTSITLNTPSTSPGNTDTPTFNVATIIAGETVSIFDGAVCGGAAIGTAAYSAATTPVTVTVTSALSVGVHQISAYITDSAGNQGPCADSGASFYEYDDTLPTDPVGSITLSSPSTPSNNTTPVISIPGVTSGDTAVLYSDNECSTQIGTAVSAGGATLVTVTTALVTEGAYEFSARSRDPAGNLSTGCLAGGSTLYTLDTTAAVTPSTITLVSPTSPGNDTTPELQVGVTTIGDTIYLYSDACTTSIGSAVAAGATTNIITSALTDGSKAFWAKAVDPSGNASGCYSAGALYTLDTVVPPIPSNITLITPASTPGNSTTPTIRVSGTVSGDTIYLYSDACTTSVGNAVAAGTTTNIVTGALAAGDHTFAARAQDPAGNFGGCLQGIMIYTLDTTPPSDPTSIALTTPASSPGNSTTPTFTVGGTTSGDTIKLYTDACTTQVGSAVAAGATTPITTSALTDASYSFWAKATDPAGNSSGCYSQGALYVLDSVAPVDNTANLTFTSALQAGNNVAITWTGFTDANVGMGDHQIKLFVTNDCSGAANYTFNTSSTLTNDNGVVDGVASGTYYATVAGIDLAGNSTTSACSGSSVTIDATAPVDNTANFTFDDPSDADGAGIAVRWTAFTDTNLSDHRITTYTNSGCSTDATSFLTGSTSFIDNTAITDLADGTYWATVEAIDSLGNSTVSACSADSIVVDSEPPVDTGPSNPQFVDNYDEDGNNISVTWTAFVDANISDYKLVTYTDGACSTGAADHGWTGNNSTSNATIIDGLTNGIYYLKVTAKDIVGNTLDGSCSTDFITVGQAVLDMDITNHNFGTNATNVTQMFTLSNTGTIPTSTVAITFTPDNPSAYTTIDNCNGMVINGGANCTITIQFNGATISSGTHNSTLESSATTGGATYSSITGTK